MTSVEEHRDSDSHDQLSDSFCSEESEGDFLSIVHANDDLEEAELELEYALMEGVPVIIIDHQDVGRATASAIRLGNIMHKTAVLAGLGCLSAGIVSRLLPLSPLAVALPCGLMSVSSVLVYDLSWRTDPCCKYQVDWDGTEFQNLPIERLRNKSPVVLVRRDDSARKVLHNTVATSAALYCVVKLFRWWRA
eukprot:Opistho-2@76823